MDANKKKVLQARIKKTLDNLQANNFNAVFVETKEDALKIVKQLVDKQSLTCSGGSLTLKECGILDYIKENTKYLNFYDQNLSREERNRLYLSNYYFASANAITEHGEIYQVDGRSNRISAIAYGPEKVILVAGINKIVKDLRSAVLRVKQTAGPMNATRLEKDTLCTKTGFCINPNYSNEHLMYEKKCGEDTICCNTLIMGYQREKGRITVIIVGEELGY